MFQVGCLINMSVQVIHEWIYLYILADKCAGGDLNKHPAIRKSTLKSYGSDYRCEKIPNRVNIEDPERTSVRGEERPEIVGQRHSVCDWELDTLIGKGHRQEIVTLIE
jgi:IS30 family transposase